MSHLATSLFNTAQWSLFVGTFFPLIAALLKQDHFSRALNTGICVVLAGVAGFVTVAAEGKIDWHNWALSLITIYTSAGVFFQHFWSPLGVEPALKSLTTPKKHRAYRPPAEAIEIAAEEPSATPDAAARKVARARRRKDSGAVDVLLIALLALVLLCFGLGFLIKWFFIVALIVLVIAAINAISARGPRV